MIFKLSVLNAVIQKTKTYWGRAHLRRQGFSLQHLRIPISYLHSLRKANALVFSLSTLQPEKSHASQYKVDFTSMGYKNTNMSVWIKSDTVNHSIFSYLF